MNAPKRLSLICADLGVLPRPAFEYLVLNLNTRQQDVEFEIISVDPMHPFLLSMAPGSTISVEEFGERATSFIAETGKDIETASKKWGRDDGMLGRPLLISLARLDVRWYHLYEETYSALFLGDWDSTMAPPSILESLVSFVTMEGLYLTFPDDPRKLSHLQTRGCLGDFNETLRDVRYKILQGFLCHDCRSIVESGLGAERTALWTTLLSKTWLGETNETTAPANLVAKLGYNLFVTKGLAPTRTEKLLNTIQEEGVKELLKVAGAVILAGLIFYLGWKL